MPVSCWRCTSAPGRAGRGTVPAHRLNPSALADQLRRHPFSIGRHWLFVPELRPAEVAKWLSDQIAVLEAPTWTELAEKIGRVGEWEFEDYDG
ncbi:Imm8 family immunity protein [Nonomuraea aridisoli]|uniref:Uncharacterized protein n=1 Tax=Nonomuraea aridisoli TaxID=2070368 RepID=A0A2W2DXJ0_9ACTN|nr:hypothetical protein C1J01_20365 [Nonomuraea aridisoli]